MNLFSLIPAAVMLAVGMVMLVFGRRSKNRNVSIGGIILIVGGIGLPVRNYFSDVIAQKQYTASQDKLYRSLDFTIYWPAYEPSGYKLYSVQPTEADSNYWYQHLEVDFIYGNNDIGDPSPYELYEDKVPPDFAPPKSCSAIDASTSAVLSANPCQQVGQTSAGEPVYYSKEIGSSNILGGWVRKGNTLIAIQTTLGTGGKYLQPEDVVKIANSLEAQTVDQLKSRGLIK